MLRLRVEVDAETLTTLQERARQERRPTAEQAAVELARLMRRRRRTAPTAEQAER